MGNTQQATAIVYENATASHELPINSTLSLSQLHETIKADDPVSAPAPDLITTLTSGSVSPGEVSALQHEVGDDAVELAALVTVKREHDTHC